MTILEDIVSSLRRDAVELDEISNRTQDYNKGCEIANISSVISDAAKKLEDIS